MAEGDNRSMGMISEDGGKMEVIDREHLGNERSGCQDAVQTGDREGRSGEECAGGLKGLKVVLNVKGRVEGENRLK